MRAEYRVLGPLAVLLDGEPVPLPAGRSHRALDDESARMFRLLSVHPGPDFDVSAAAALAGVSVARARRMLERLVADHLVQTRTPGRYDLRDLLRAYAAELCGDDEAAALRLTEWYVHTLENAALYESSRMLTRAGEITSGVVPQEFSSRFDALAWVRQDWDNIQAVAHTAIARGWGRLGMVVAAHLNAYLLFTKQRCNEAIGLFEAARSFGTPREQGFMLLKLAGLYGDVERLDDALRCFEDGLRFAHETGERVAEAAGLINMSVVHRQLGRVDDAVDCSQRGLAVAVELADPYYESAARANVALHLRLAGRYEEALVESERALVVVENYQDKLMHVKVHGLHSRILAKLGRLDEAVPPLNYAIDVSLQFGDNSGAAEGFRDVGECLAELGRRDEAAEVWRRAVTIWRELGDPRADEVTALLEALR